MPKFIPFLVFSVHKKNVSATEKSKSNFFEEENSFFKKTGYASANNGVGVCCKSESNIST